MKPNKQISAKNRTTRSEQQTPSKAANIFTDKMRFVTNLTSINKRIILKKTLLVKNI